MENNDFKENASADIETTENKDDNDKNSSTISSFIGIIIAIAIIVVVGCIIGNNSHKKDKAVSNETTVEENTEYDEILEDENFYNDEDIFIKTNTRYIYNNLDDYYYTPITTTIKINYIYDDYYCGYVVDGTEKYDSFVIAFDFENSSYSCYGYEKGDYLTVSGYADTTDCDYGAVIIDVKEILETDKTLFKEISKKPKEAKHKNKTINNLTGSNNFTANGSGDYVAKGLKVENYAILNITTSGNDGNFAVTSYKDGEYEDLLVNTIDDYTGTVLVPGSGTYDLEIKCDSGSWNITSSGLKIDDKSSFSGNGDAVTGLTSHCGGSWKIKHTGSDNFSIVQYGINYGYMDLLVNEIGNYSGTVMASEKDEAVFFQVNADGAWTLEQE